MRRSVESFAELLRVAGHGLAGVFPALRSPDGTFGTARAQAKERAARRRTDYPTDR